jgi:type IV secretion system protein VirB6
MELFANIFTSYLDALTAFLDTAIGYTIRAFLPVASTCLGIYFILYAWAGIRGKVQDWGNDMVARTIKLVLILSIGFTVAGYGQYVLNPVLNLPTDLTSVITHRTADEVAGPAILDQQLTKALGLGNDAMSRGGITSRNGVAFYVAAAIFYLDGLLMTIYAAYLILLSNGMLTILLAFGPIFIGCLIFDVTKRFFDAWLGLIVNYMFVNVFAVTIVSFTFVAFQRYLDNMTPESGLGGALGLLVIAVINVLIIMGVPHVASSLAGGSPIGTGFANWVVWTATGGASRVLAKHLGKGAKWTGAKAIQGATAAARAATSRFRMNSVKGL